MADIRLSVQIDVPPAEVYPLISSGAGFSKWWAEDMTQRSDGTIDLGFFKRAMVYSVRLVKTVAPSQAEWACLNGKEWEGTRLLFQQKETKGQTLLVFTHANWEKETDYFVSCSATWGALRREFLLAFSGDPDCFLLEVHVLPGQIAEFLLPQPNEKQRPIDSFLEGIADSK